MRWVLPDPVPGIFLPSRAEDVRSAVHGTILWTAYLPALAAKYAVAAGKPETLGAGLFCLHNLPFIREIIKKSLLENSRLFFSIPKKMSGL